MTNEQKAAFLNEVAVMVPHDDNEPMRINSVVDGELYCTGEESSEEYVFDLNEVNLDDYMFYRLTLVTPQDMLAQ
jgi:hypothetical protein